ncbi:MAG: 50S ribosomal protein L9 [Bacteroidota bacterium]
MEIILLKDLGTLGDKHDVVTVKPGYGRNYLIPKGLAVIANKTNLGKLDDLIAREKAEEDKKIEEFKATLASLDGKTLRIGVKAGTSGKIFGSITSIQISNALKEQFNVDIPRKKIEVEDIKELGTYAASLHLHDSVKGEIPLELVQE